MTYTIQVCLVGLSGSGKTTLLKALSPFAILIAEQERLPTPEEAEAWDVPLDSLVSTSSAPNYANVIFDENCKLKNHTITDQIQKTDIVCTIYDTIGQEIYYPIRKSTAEGSQGILFVIDSAVPVIQQKDNLIQAYSEVISFFDELVPTVVICNKQDIIDRKNLIKNKDSGSYGKAEQIKIFLNSFLPEFRNCRYFNTSAVEKWGIKKPIEYLVFEIMERIKEGKY